MKIYTLLFLLFLSSIALADPIFHGNVKHKSDINKIYSTLPKFGKDIDFHLWELNSMSWSIVDAYNKDEGVVGLYFNEQAKIFLKELSTSDVKLVFVHEYGHHIYYTALSEKERILWESFWLDNINNMPSEYAKTSSIEGFAECFTGVYYSGFVSKYFELKPFPSSVENKVRTLLRDKK